jgi:hypothetical protein
LTSTTHWTHCYHSCHTKLSVISAVLKTSGLELVFIVKGFGLYWKHLDLNWCSLWKVLGFTESIWTWIGVHCERFWTLLKASGLEMVFIVEGFGLYWNHLDFESVFNFIVKGVGLYLMSFTSIYSFWYNFFFLVLT